jgi:hypothetical protein
MENDNYRYINKNKNNENSLVNSEIFSLSYKNKNNIIKIDLNKKKFLENEDNDEYEENEIKGNKTKKSIKVNNANKANIENVNYDINNDNKSNNNIDSLSSPLSNLFDIEKGTQTSFDMNNNNDIILANKSKIQKCNFNKNENINKNNNGNIDSKNNIIYNKKFRNNDDFKNSDDDVNLSDELEKEIQKIKERNYKNYFSDENKRSDNNIILKENTRYKAIKNNPKKTKSEKEKEKLKDANDININNSNNIKEKILNNPNFNTDLNSNSNKNSSPNPKNEIKEKKKFFTKELIIQNKDIIIDLIPDEFITNNPKYKKLKNNYDDLQTENERLILNESEMMKTITILKDYIKLQEVNIKKIKLIKIKYKII